LTNSAGGLAGSDVDTRWIGVRRHQALLVISGIALLGDAVVRARAPLFELLIGLALALGAAPLAGGATVAEFAAIAVRFALRSRWLGVGLERDDDGVMVTARGHTTVRAYRLAHVGRLDLAGHDVEHADALARFVDAVASAGEDRHVSLHVRTAPEGPTTLLAVDGDAVPPPEWCRDDDLVSVTSEISGPHAWVMERWSYVRTRHGARAVLRVRDFSASAPGHAVLGRAQLASDQTLVSVHATVVSSTRGLRIAERAVHRHRSDGATSAAAGFRRTARVEHSFERLREREAQVASGRALIRLAVFVTVRSESLSELGTEVMRVRRALHESGLRAERGWGRQGEWFCRQLPGGPGW
jgi:hypothetical protein